MNLRKLWPLLAALTVSTAAAQEESSCTLPGILVSEDPAGDHQIAPTGEGFADILSLHMAEPASMPGRLVFTFKMSDLANVPPNTLWSIRFSTDVPPPNGDEQYFVAMVTGPDGAAHFIYGTEVLENGAAPRLWTPAGELDPSSSFSPEGTIALVLDKSKIPGLEIGGAVFGLLPTTRVDFTPTDGGLPFTTGLVAMILDTSADGFYEVVGTESCGESKFAILGAGSVPATTLSLLALAVLIGRRRKTALVVLATLVSGATIAAEPESGTLSEANPRLEYVVPASATANASGATMTNYTCDAVNPCDEYSLTIDLPADYVEKYPNAIVRVEAATDEEALDIDLQVSDEEGNVVYNYRDNPPAQPAITIFPSGGIEKFIVQVVPGTPHTGAKAAITLMPGDEAGKSLLSFAGAFGGGHLAALVLGLLAGLGRQNPASRAAFSGREL